MRRWVPGTPSYSRNQCSLNVKWHTKWHTNLYFKRVDVKKPLNNQGFNFLLMVELGGIEPPSANPLQIDLHT